MCSAAPRVSASERKKCGTSSVGNSPTQFAIEATLPHEERPAREVESDLSLCLVHGQQEPVACNAALVAQRSRRAVPRAKAQSSIV